MTHVLFKTVDVFTSVPFKGNPVAVVLDAGHLSSDQMQQIARWTNLSETTFIVPTTHAGADYHVRIFTPGAELPFAGHPTIGTAHALLEAGMIQAKDGALVQQCAAGLIQLRIRHEADASRWISFELPKAELSALDSNATGELEAILGMPLDVERPPYLVDVGPRWVVVQLPAAESVLELRPDLQRMKIQDTKGGHTGVVVFGKHAAGAYPTIEVRAFAPAHGINEDPVCGSGNGCVAAYIRHTGQTAQFGSAIVATQGAVVGRAGVLQLTISAHAIQVGGQAITCVSGELINSQCR